MNRTPRRRRRKQPAPDAPRRSPIKLVPDPHTELGDMIQSPDFFAFFEKFNALCDRHDAKFAALTRKIRAAMLQEPTP